MYAYIWSTEMLKVWRSVWLNKPARLTIVLDCQIRDKKNSETVTLSTSDGLILIFVFAEWVNDCSEWFLDLFSGGDVATFVFAKLEMKMHFQPSLPASLFPLELILFQPSFKLSTDIPSKLYSCLFFSTRKYLQLPHFTPLGLISSHQLFKSTTDLLQTLSPLAPTNMNSML